MSKLLLGVVAVLVLGVWSLTRVRAEYRTRDELSRLTAAGIWILYSLHLALTLAAAFEHRWAMTLPRPLALGAGMVFIVGGAGLFVAGMVTFRSFKRISGLDTSRLVTGGVYRWSRNPQNVGAGLFLVGVALVGGSWLALLLAGLFCVSFRSYLPAEEAFLERAFGDTYSEYRSRTHRYLGPPIR
jgi:protein-S-isoprenylcysteine O-methyltransferase Ste14